jgi:hypothetical protein
MIWGVCGLWGFHGRNNVTKILNRLNTLGVSTKEFHNITFTLLHTYIIRQIFSIANRLYDQASDGDSIIAHSFGGVLVIDMLNEINKKRPKEFKNIYLFNPSINGDVHIDSDHFQKMYIFHEPRDRMLKMANWLPFNILGDLGRYGYKYTDDKIINVEINKITNEHRMHHDNAMIEPNLTTYAKFIRDVEVGNE